MAIAFNTTADYVVPNNTTSDSFAFTCSSGSDRYLQVCVAQGQGSNADVITGITYNGVAMTRLATLAQAGGNNRVYVYGLVAPATGANNIVLARNADAQSGGWLFAEDFTGVDQTAVPSNTNNAGATGAAGVTNTITVAGGTSWVGGIGSNNYAQIVIDSGGTIRSNTQNVARCNFDTNGTVAAGSFSTVWSASGTGEWNTISVEIKAVAAAAAAGRPNNLMLLGVS